MTVTPDDSARLWDWGIMSLLNLTNFSTITLLHGMFIMVFSIAVYTTLHRGLKSRPTLVIFILIILSFTAANIYWAVWMASLIIQFRWVLVKNVGMELSKKFALANVASAKPELVEMYLEPFMWIVNDIAVIWRAWVLYPEHQWVMVGPLLFLLATIVMALTYLVMYTMSIILYDMLATLSNCTLAFSMATNLLSTLLIGYKLWHHQKARSNLGLKKQRSDVQKVLFLLVESGFFYLAIQLASLLLSFVGPSGTDTAADYAANVFYGFGNEFSGMYPALILIIVNKECSIVNTFGFSTVLGSSEGYTNSAEHHPAPIGHLVFNPPTQGTVDSEQFLSPIVPGGPRSSDSCVA
ncbi:hypothetical protein L208DRAFT_1411759 [Tricholoma matsutake]|nr:hypothetical protein L208DRAFT_1411759 [Tricholoma matsutake 945]